MGLLGAEDSKGGGGVCPYPYDIVNCVFILLVFRIFAVTFDLFEGLRWHSQLHIPVR